MCIAIQVHGGMGPAQHYHLSSWCSYWVSSVHTHYLLPLPTQVTFTDLQGKMKLLSNSQESRRHWWHWPSSLLPRSATLIPSTPQHRLPFYAQHRKSMTGGMGAACTAGVECTCHVTTSLLSAVRPDPMSLREPQLTTTTFCPELLERADKCCSVRFHGWISHIDTVDSEGSKSFLEREGSVKK